MTYNTGGQAPHQKIDFEVVSKKIQEKYPNYYNLFALWHSCGGYSKVYFKLLQKFLAVLGVIL